MIEPFSKFCVDVLFHQDSRTSKISKKAYDVFYEFVILTIYIKKTNLVGSIVLKSSTANKQQTRPRIKNIHFVRETVRDREHLWIYKSLEISLSTDYFGQHHNSTSGLEARVQLVD